MKTKLITNIVLTLLVVLSFSRWSLAANQNPRGIPDEIQQMKQDIEALNKTVAAQQAELDKLRPLGDAFQVFPTGIYTTRWLQASAIIANVDGVFTTDIYYSGSIVHY